MTNLFKHQLNIKGMHCHSCELIIKDSLEALPNVQSIKADYKNGTLELQTNNADLNSVEIEDVIKPFGYKIVKQTELGFDWSRFFGYFILFFGLAWLLFKLGWTGSGTKLDSPLAALLLGVIASLSSCLAVVGGVVISLGSVWANGNSRAEQITAQVLFQLGRFVTFVILGGVLGLIGSSFNFSIGYSGWLMIIVGWLMLMLAFKQLAIKIPGLSFGSGMLKKVNHLSSSKHPLMPMVLGGLTFFLPCGFTQTVQLFAMASGSFIVGAMASGLFALGTLPVLFLLGIGSGRLAKAKNPLFNKLAAVVVGVFALLIINSGLALIGHPVFIKTLKSATNGVRVDEAKTTSPVFKDGAGEQVVKMVVDYSGYSPEQIKLKVGVPVRWQIIGQEIGGCNSSIVVPSYKIFKQLNEGLNEITFTPTKPGRIAFSCGMGMITGQFIVTE